jgi:hypothetical protein
MHFAYPCARLSSRYPRVSGTSRPGTSLAIPVKFPRPSHLQRFSYMQKVNDIDCLPADHCQSLRACVFLQKPFRECYCMNMTSSNIRKMLSFCIGDFRSCVIYRKESEKEATGSDS